MTDPIAALSAALAGRYRLERELGRGGMATVYLAQDLRHDRTVAIKVLRPELAALLGAERFLNEIRTTARLRHPHILPLFDSGRTEGLLFYVMPLVEGESLRARLDRNGPLPLAEALRITKEVADALAYAHGQEVIHRDIKPENILLERGHALVADFGIARAVNASGDLRLTETGHSLGTPLYMSPEQSAGDAVIDGRSDLYSLGSVLFEMLTGEPPFRGPTAEAILVQRFTQAPPRVSERRNDVPAAVDIAIRRALARDPDERQAGVERFAAMLQEGPASLAGDGKSIAVLPFVNMSADPDNEYFGDGIAEDIINALTRIDGLRVAARTSAFSFKGRQDDLRVIGDKLDVATVLEGSVRKAGGRLRITAQLISAADGYHLWSERYDRELVDVFAVQDEIAAAIAGKLELTFAKPADPPGRATPAAVEAYELIARGRALSAQRGRAILEAIACFQRAIELVPDSPAAHANLGNAYRLKAQYGLGERAELHPLAEAEYARALALDPDNAEALGHLGTLRLNDPAIGEADGILLHERALALDPRLSEIRGLYGGWALGILGQGKHDEQAERELRRMIADDPLNPICSTIFAVGMSALGKPEEAVAEAQRACQYDPAAFGPHYVLAWAQTWSRHTEDGIATVHACFDRFGRHPWLLQALTGLYMQRGDQRRAEAVHAELTARAVTSWVPYFSLAVSAAYLGRIDEALAHAERSAELRDAIGPVWFRWPDMEMLRADPRYSRVLEALRR